MRWEMMRCPARRLGDREVCGEMARSLGRLTPPLSDREIESARLLSARLLRPARPPAVSHDNDNMIITSRGAPPPADDHDSSNMITTTCPAPPPADARGDGWVESELMHGPTDRSRKHG